MSSLMKKGKISTIMSMWEPEMMSMMKKYFFFISFFPSKVSALSFFILATFYLSTSSKLLGKLFLKKNTNVSVKKHFKPI